MDGEIMSGKVFRFSLSRRRPGIGVEEDLLGGAGFKTSGSKTGRFDPARMLVGMGLARRGRVRYCEIWG